MGDGISKPQPNLSFDELYKQAHDSMPLLEHSAQSLLNRLKEQHPETFKNVRFEMGSIKTIGRTAEKSNYDYGGDHRQVKDIVRGQFVVETPEQIKILKQALQDDLNINGTLNDKFARPNLSGYRDINTKVELENGHIAEIQVGHKAMLEVKPESHKLMVRAQEITRGVTAEKRALNSDEIEELRELNMKSKELNLAAAYDAGLEDLIDPNLKDGLSYKGKLDANGSALGALAETFGDMGKNGGFVAGVALSGLASAFTLAAGGSEAEAVEILYEGVVPYGETQLDLYNGDIEAAQRSATIETVSNGASFGGAIAGAAAGTMILPGVGTVIGGIIGAIGSGVSAGYLTGLVYDNYEDIKEYQTHVSDEAGEFFNDMVDDTKSLFASWFEDDLDIETAFEKLPDQETPDMPPEVASLVVLKSSPELFEKQFNELKEIDALGEVNAYLENYKPESLDLAPAYNSTSEFIPVENANKFSPV